MNKKLFLFILLLVSQKLQAQVLCDTSNHGVFQFLEHPPKASIDIKELESKINETFTPSEMNNYFARKMYISFFINCRGEDFDYKLFTSNNGTWKQDSTSEFQEKLLANFESFVSFTPALQTTYVKGKELKKAVDFRELYTLNIERNKIHLQKKKQ